MQKKLLNVGGGTKDIPINLQGSEAYEHHLLDIVPGEGVDIVMDARKLQDADELRDAYDLVYCSHNLEHYTAWEGSEVLAGFHNVLTPNGYAYIIIPDVQQALLAMFLKGENLTSVAYDSPGGPIRYLDIIYGHEAQAEMNEFMRHKTAFTEQSLAELCVSAGFEPENVYTHRVLSTFEIHCVAARREG